MSAKHAAPHRRRQRGAWRWRAGPVCARGLTLSRLALGATPRIDDSLQRGARALDEKITRTGEIVDLGYGPVPALFLIDEMPSGPTRTIRRIGAEAVLRALDHPPRPPASRPRTTRARAENADALGPADVNVHFEDEYRDGQDRVLQLPACAPAWSATANALGR